MWILSPIPLASFPLSHPCGGRSAAAGVISQGSPPSTSIAAIGAICRRSRCSSFWGEAVSIVRGVQSPRGKPTSRHMAMAAATAALQSASEAAAAATTNTAAPAWDELRAMLGDKGLKEERVPHAKERLFGTTGEPRVVLYRDNSAWCPYCHRVWLQLEEKEIPYKVEKVNMRCYGPKPQWYTRMVPSGLLPAIQIDGKLMTESLDIMIALEGLFAEYKPLLPVRGTPERQETERLLQLERRTFGSWLRFLTSSWGNGAQFEATLDDVDAALAKRGGPYFLGKELSFADCVFAPFLERIASSVPYWKGVTVRRGGRWAHLNAWYNAMDSRPAYANIKNDDFGITHNLEPQIGPCGSLPAGAAYRDMIDGKAGSWDLPLGPETTAWGFDDGTGSGGAKEEAAQSLIENGEAVVGFALRVFGRDGEKHRPAVDAAFRQVAHALLAGTESAGVPTPPSGGATSARDVAIAAAYLRDRVGVPRDMSYPAARQLRAHLQWVVKGLGSS